MRFRDYAVGMNDSVRIRPAVLHVLSKIGTVTANVSVKDNHTYEHDRYQEGVIVDRAYCRLTGDIGRQFRAVCYGHCDVSDLAEYARTELRDLGLLVDGAVPAVLVEIVRNNFYVDAVT